MRRRTTDIDNVLEVIERYLQVVNRNQSKQRRSLSKTSDRAKGGAARLLNRIFTSVADNGADCT